MAAKFKDTEKKKMFFSVCDFFSFLKQNTLSPFLSQKKKKPHKIEEVSTVVLIFIEIIQHKK